MLDEVFGELADDIELAFEILRVLGIGRLRVLGLADNNLANYWLAFARCRSDRRVVRRHIAPADKLLVFVPNHFFEELFAAVAVGRVLRQKDEAGAVFARRRQVHAQVGGFMLQEAMWHLDEDARAVPRVGLATTGAAMFQVLQDLQGILDDLMGFAVFEVRDEAHAASVVFILGIVQALGAWFNVRHDRPRS